MTTNMSYRNALKEALKAEMQIDSQVFVFGLDVDDHKSIFGSTDQLLQQFGSDRVFGTPLSEDAMTGFAIGAALAGRKPVHIHIRADFSLLAVNQLVNMASNVHYLTAGQLSVPITIRMVIGRGWGQGLQHSKSVHSLFSHFPGLKVFMPSSPQEAYSLLRQAVQDPNPVIFIEHRWLYDVEGPVDLELKQLPSVTRVTEGRHITVVANSWMTIEAMKAADFLRTYRIELDILSVNQITSLDYTQLSDSVKKTGHCILVDHDWNEFGLNSELSANLNEYCFGFLKKPVKRIGQKFVPCPTARNLENVFYPKAQDIIRSALTMYQIDIPELKDEEFYTYENKFKGPF